MMGKLVRDRIPDIIRGMGRVPVTRVLERDEYAVALRAKLVEEALELQTCRASEFLEEAADVYEVLIALVADRGLDFEAVIAKAQAKRVDRGAFDKRVWLQTE